ncbi:MAG: hypothetical protein QXJ75_01380 [Candidatus Bathyarchaeia archaeon]
MPCYILLLKGLGLRIPEDKDLLRRLEDDLMRRLKVSSHEELHAALEDKAREDSWELKMLIQEMIASYQLKVKKKRKAKEGEEVGERAQVYAV